MADALHDWIPSVIQSVEPFLSTEMDMGTRWSAEIGSQLDETSFGIICVTPENVTAPWLNFEAGALGKSIKGAQTHVVPLLLGFRSSSDLQPPLGQFQAALAHEADVRRVIRTINGLAEPPLSETRLKESFVRWWPDLDQRLKAIEDSSDTPTATRDAGDKLDELLSLNRQMMVTLQERTASYLTSSLDRAISPIRDRPPRSAMWPSIVVLPPDTQRQMLDAMLNGIMTGYGIGPKAVIVKEVLPERVLLEVVDRELSPVDINNVVDIVSRILGQTVGVDVVPRLPTEVSGEDV